MRALNLTAAVILAQVASQPPPSDAWQEVTIWFDQHFLPAGESFHERTLVWAERPRRALRKEVVDTLKARSARAYEAARAWMRDMEAEGSLRDCRRHWIIAGMSCSVRGSLDRLRERPGVGKVLRRPPFIPTAAGRSPMGPTHFTSERRPFRRDGRAVSWNVAAIGAPEVWTRHGLTGAGVLVVVSDLGFLLDSPVTAPTLFRSPTEVPDNGTDDDGNGLVDDYHGYDFDRGTSELNAVRLVLDSIIHGHVTAAVVSGRATTDTGLIVGVAPDATWAPVIGTFNIEESVEWALEQDADIFSMSFSIPGLGAYRAHWRRVMENGALAGLFFVSGAGNFGDPSLPNYVDVPRQMRIPEDIPDAVFAVAGVDADSVRPTFSSQGPVVWMTDPYQEGSVLKPDLTTYNMDIAVPDFRGRQTVAFGNSMAGPHLAGVLALMLQADPDLTPWRGMQILRETAKDLDPTGPDNGTGWGLVDGLEAVERTLACRRGNCSD